MMTLLLGFIGLVEVLIEDFENTNKIGGKSKAYKQVTELLPFFPLPRRIISPFIGGGSLEFTLVRWASEHGIPVKGFDIFWCLTNYWKHQLEN